MHVWLRITYTISLNPSVFFVTLRQKTWAADPSVWKRRWVHWFCMLLPMLLVTGNRYYQTPPTRSLPSTQTPLTRSFLAPIQYHHFNSIVQFANLLGRCHTLQSHQVRSCASSKSKCFWHIFSRWFTAYANIRYHNTWANGKGLRHPWYWTLLDTQSWRPWGLLQLLLAPPRNVPWSEGHSHWA
jgi:hypothetical protein